jgi:UDPglucose 6-dehydrogenase
VNSVVAQLNEVGYKGLVAIKSTVVPGTSARLQEEYPSLRMASVPEFLRAKTALADFVYNHDVLVIGTFNESDANLVEEIHGSLPKSVSKISPTEAEIIKYFNNVHHSVSIIFANIAYEVCKRLGVNYSNVYETIIKRECFNPAYLKCNDNMRGFGGHCLPKDTSAWNNLIKNLGLEFELIQAALNDNKRV